MKTQVCPLCNSDKLNHIMKGENFDIDACNNCKIAFTNPLPVLPDYEEMDFTSKETAQNYEQLKSLNDLPYDWKVLINLQVDTIHNNLGKESSILEIGCGEGILLEELSKKGFRNIMGFEPSKTGAVRAKKRKLNVVNEYFDESKVNHKYDLVMMSHVFEHIEEPLSFLNQIKNVLNTNGRVMLTQTNYRGLIPRILKNDWYAWVPEQHYWHFTPESLEKIFLKNDFRDFKVTYTSLVHPHDLKYRIANKIPFLKDQFIFTAIKN